MKDEQLIKHAYEQVVTAAARLASFATGRPTASFGPISERQEMLVLDDLAHFAYHGRRLISLTGTQNKFRSIVIPGPPEIKNDLILTKILNIIIHHEDIIIVRTKLHAELIKCKAEGGSEEEMMNILMRYKNPSNYLIPVIVSVQSDHSDVTSFRLENLINVFESKILKDIINACSERKIYLDMEF